MFIIQDKYAFFASVKLKELRYMHTKKVESFKVKNIPDSGSDQDGWKC